MALLEFVIFLLTCKERVHAGYLELHVDIAGELVTQCAECDEVVLVRGHGRAHGGEEVGVVHVDGVLLVQLQRADKRRLELGEEVQRAAEEGDMAADRLAAGETGDGLIDHGLEDRGGQVLLRSPLIDQRLNV